MVSVPWAPQPLACTVRLGDAFQVLVRKLFDQLIVLQQDRTARARRR